MAAIAGYGGSVKLGANTVARVKQWSLTINNELLEISSLGNQWKEFLPGLLGAEASLDVAVDPSDTNGQNALRSANLGSTSVTLNLYINSTNYYSGTAFVNSYEPSAAVDAAVEGSLSCTYSDAVTYN